jgi:hypothetical protein
MSNITTALLDFLMGLMRDPNAAAEFRGDPDGALTNAGLNGICAADVDAVLPVALDFSPVGNREYDTGGNSIDSSASGGAWGGGGGGGGGGWGGGGGGGGHHGGGKGDWGGHGGGKGDYDMAVQKIMSVVNNYSYIDDRDVINDQSTNTNIWAEDSIVGVNNEVENTSTNVGDGSIVATTGGTVIAGNTEYDLEVDIEDSFNEENELEIEDSFNDNSDNSTTNVAVDSFNTDNSTDNSTEIEDSFNTDVEIEDSFNETDTEVDVEIEDSFNTDNSTEIDVEIEDSFNEDNSVDNSTNTDVEVDIEDSFNDNEIGNTDNSVEVEDSFNDNNIESGPGDLNETNVDVEVEVEDSFNTETDIEDSFQVNDNAVETGPGDQIADNEVDLALSSTGRFGPAHFRCAGPNPLFVWLNRRTSNGECNGAATHRTRRPRHRPGGRRRPARPPETPRADPRPPA